MNISIKKITVCILAMFLLLILMLYCTSYKRSKIIWQKNDSIYACKINNNIVMPYVFEDHQIFYHFPLTNKQAMQYQRSSLATNIVNINSTVSKQANIIDSHALPVATVGNNGYEYNQKGLPIKKHIFKKNTIFTLKNKLRQASYDYSQYYQCLDCTIIYHPNDDSTFKYYRLYVPMRHMNNKYFYCLKNGNLLLANDVSLIDGQKLIGVNVPCYYTSSFRSFYNDYQQAETYESNQNQSLIAHPAKYKDVGIEDSLGANDKCAGLQYDTKGNGIFENDYSYFHQKLRGWKGYTKSKNLLINKFRFACNSINFPKEPSKNITLKAATPFNVTNSCKDNYVYSKGKYINYDHDNYAKYYPMIFADNVIDYKYFCKMQRIYKSLPNLYILRLNLKVNNKSYSINFPYDAKHIANSKYLKLDSSMRYKLVGNAPNVEPFYWPEKPNSCRNF